MPFAGQFYNPDQWDGYTAARARVLQQVSDAQVDNLVVLTGDIHAAGIGELVGENPDGTPSTVAFGTEFVGGSISSTFDPALADVAEELILQLPHVRFADTHSRVHGVRRHRRRAGHPLPGGGVGPRPRVAGHDRQHVGHDGGNSGRPASLTGRSEPDPTRRGEAMTADPRLRRRWRAAPARHRLESAGPRVIASRRSPRRGVVGPESAARIRSSSLRYGAPPVSPSRRVIGAVVSAAVLGTGALAGTAALVGCSGDSSGGEAEADDEVRTVQPGAPGEAGRELTDEEAAAIEAPEHTATDTEFMQGMIAHHQQALAMAALVAERTDRTDLPLLAERITVSQEAEIELIEQWLTDRGEPVPDDAAHEHAQHEAHARHGHAPSSSRSWSSPRGAPFDRLFLELMIAHHQGALAMVDELYAAGGGLEPAVDGFAREVEADQTIEITRMQEHAGDPGTVTAAAAAAGSDQPAHCPTAGPRTVFGAPRSIGAGALPVHDERSVDHGCGHDRLDVAGGVVRRATRARARSSRRRRRCRWRR